MFEVSKAAKEQLDMHFEGKEASPIRVYLAGGCGGPRLALALDDQKDTDVVYEVDGHTFLVEKTLMGEAKTMLVEFHPYMGFNVKSELKIQNTGGCSSCTSCG
jgi:Fe-S cluster assembly iron-binding protein IscA